jgi:hypothetical protein
MTTKESDNDNGISITGCFIAGILIQAARHAPEKINTLFDRIVRDIPVERLNSPAAVAPVRRFAENKLNAANSTGAASEREEYQQPKAKSERGRIMPTRRCKAVWTPPHIPNTLLLLKFFRPPSIIRSQKALF